MVNVVAIYDAVSGNLLRIVVPDFDSQLTDPQGPCAPQIGEAVLHMPMETWLANPSVAAVQALVTAAVAVPAVPSVEDPSPVIFVP